MSPSKNLPGAATPAKTVIIGATGHDAECGYNEVTGTGCTHTHDEGIKPCDNNNGPLG